MARLAKSTILQRRIGTLGQLQDYRSSTDRQHTSIGWWATPAPAPVDGCSCPFCEASREQRDVYLGFDTVDAGVTAELAVRAHELAGAATPAGGDRVRRLSA